MSVEAYHAHIISQIQDNVAFLVEQNCLAKSNADTIMSLLPGVSSNLINSPPARVGPPLPARRATASGRMTTPGAIALPSMTYGAQDPPASPRRAVPPVPALPPRSAPPPAITVEDTGAVYARALWAYNTNNEDPNDLTFAKGDTIEIIEETNPDWWRGHFQGREGLFPSNYVEKLSDEDAAPAYTSSSNVYTSEKSPIAGPARRPYKPFMASHHGADKPPPSGSGTVNSVGLQEAGGQEQKKSKFGKLGNTMANSAAGGVGFGAGAAIGGGLVRAIF